MGIETADVEVEVGATAEFAPQTTGSYRCNRSTGMTGIMPETRFSVDEFNLMIEKGTAVTLLPVEGPEILKEEFQGTYEMIEARKILNGVEGVFTAMRDEAMRDEAIRHPMNIHKLKLSFMTLEVHQDLNVTMTDEGGTYVFDRVQLAIEHCESITATQGDDYWARHPLRLTEYRHAIAWLGVYETISA